MIKLTKKDVRQNTSNDVDMFLCNQKRHDDTNCKEISLEKGESSSPPFPVDDGGQQEFDMDEGNSHRVRKPKKGLRHEGFFEHTASMTQNEIARNKTTSHGTSKYIHPRIKVGSVVLLKTANYPNKEVVAYATILSSSPQSEVGGVKIGNQFYKVCVNHAISENELLVRPVSGYKILADVCGKGALVAWPSICVCYTCIF